MNDDSHGFPKTEASPASRWYEGINRYQWLVLVVASLGWAFDIFEGQIFVASMREAMPSLVAATQDVAVGLSDQASSADADANTQGLIDFLNKAAMASFLVGGALGGVLFGALSDRIGRARTLSITIVVYSLFTFLTAFAQAPWQMIALRFVVALGTGGEWAVGAVFVAEVFPKRSRPWMGSIFHGSSVLGTLLAVVAGAYIIGNASLGADSWRWGFMLGALPALLIVWIRFQVREPERWVQSRDQSRTDARLGAGNVLELFSSKFLARTVLGVALSTTGIATFWGVHIFGKSVTLDLETRRIVSEAGEGASQGVSPVRPTIAATESRKKRAEMLGMLLTTLGGGVGLVMFGAISHRLGRRGAFVFYYLGGFVATLFVFLVVYGTQWPWLIYASLPVFGFLTLGMHAGYAVYFPELYPTRLRSSGGGFCFNVGRLTAAPILIITAFAQLSSDQGGWGWSNEKLASWMSLLFLVGAGIACVAPETRDEELPD